MTTNRKRKGPIVPTLLYTVVGEIGDEAEIGDSSLAAASVINGKAIVPARSSLNRTRIVQSTGLRVRNWRVETTDAANARMDESCWDQVLIEESRWTGARMNSSHLHHVTCDRRQMNYVQIQESRLRDVRFESCDMQRAYFNGSQMQGTIFEGCNLTEADFSSADIAACDFRRAIK